jgi:hypothetical protein
MLGLFRKSAPVHDPVLGALTRTRGCWRGEVRLGSTATGVPLAVAGDRDAPDAAALEAARQLVTRYAEWQPAIAQALFEEHYVHGRDAVAGLPEADAYPAIARADDVWPHVTPVFVSVMPMRGPLVTEIGYTTAWDEEHTLGARFVDGRLVELNGSVVEP